MKAGPRRTWSACTAGVRRACHKYPRVRELVESVGAEVWYLPPYSPDFNPIEQMWSKIKQVLRTLAARTFEGLIKAIGIAIKQVTPQNLIGWFTHGGHGT
jgi:transposase